MAGEWSVSAILSRTEHQFDDLTSLTQADDFFAQQLDLIVDTANPHVLQTHGCRALRSAQLWTVNASALADVHLYNALEEAGKAANHRLRVLTGAIAGLDGVATFSVDPEATVTAVIEVAPSAEPRKTLFRGTAEEAAAHFPDSVNVGVAAALAGPGTERMQIEVVRPHNSDGRKLKLTARGAYGEFESISQPRVVPREIHTVAASIIAALRREDRTIWVG